MVREEIIFDPIPHTYKGAISGKYYTSVTTLIGKYKEPFKTEYWAKVKSKELGVSVEMVKYLWNKEKEKGCERGNIEHDLLENSINGFNKNAAFKYDTSINTSKNLVQYIDNAVEVNIERLRNSPLGIKYPTILKVLEDAINKGYKIYAEVTIYWYSFLVSGRIDCIAVKGKEFVIIDWKTNKDKLSFTSGYYKKINGVKSDIWVPKDERLLYPINELPNCKGMEYTMQLSLYAYLLEMWGYTCKGLILFHIRVAKDQTEPRLCVLDYKRDACRRLMEHRCKGLKF